MPDKSTAPKDVDAYIAGYPPEVRERLQKIRETIRSVAPEAEETIKYGMPTYVFAGNLVYFAAYKRHIALYPVPAGDAAFQEALAQYRAEKSTVRFPHGRPIPLDLVEKLVRFRVEEQLEIGPEA